MQKNVKMEHLLRFAPVLPLVQAEEPNVAINVSRALASGGLKVVEVVLRTVRALDCLREVAAQVPEVFTGAGTVLTAEQAEASIENGANFIVSPGLDEDVIRVGEERAIPVYPGIMTATEVQHAYKLGLRTVKLFPASMLGGDGAVQAFASVFPGMRFIPTGGVTAGNLADYFSEPAVLACGGSWMTPKSAVDAADFAMIARLAADAVRIARTARGFSGEQVPDLR
jgi:2-dehydro-3-deoxyphosphogluconate aldolase/(4S)-4-hydroxy-2-oxoglutarate aldolase